MATLRRVGLPSGAVLDVVDATDGRYQFDVGEAPSFAVAGFSAVVDGDPDGEDLGEYVDAVLAAGQLDEVEERLIRDAGRSCRRRALLLIREGSVSVLVAGAGVGVLRRAGTRSPRRLAYVAASSGVPVRRLSTGWEEGTRLAVVAGGAVGCELDGGGPWWPGGTEVVPDGIDVGLVLGRS